MSEFSDHYLATVARRVGVLPFWIDDAVQEMRIALWRHPDNKYPNMVVRSAAIDFHRKQAHFNRRTGTSPGVDCFTAVEETSLTEGISPLDTFTTNEPPVDDVIDARDAIGRLPERAKRLLGGFLRGDRQQDLGEIEGISGSRVSQLVRRIREGLAA